MFKNLPPPVRSLPQPARRSPGEHHGLRRILTPVHGGVRNGAPRAILKTGHGPSLSPTVNAYYS